MKFRLVRCHSLITVAELFEEDREIVMFRSPEELLEKVDYYLAHDRERRQIAEAGLKKVMRCYTYEKKMRELLDWMADPPVPLLHSAVLSWLLHWLYRV